MTRRLTTRQMARELGISGPLVSVLSRKGMPMNDVLKAKEWRALYVRPRAKPERPEASGGHPEVKAPAAAEGENVVDLYATEIGFEQLEDTIPRLRRLEKATAVALEKATKEGNIAAIVALRREHVTALKTLYGAEEKLIRIGEKRGRLVGLDRAQAMIGEALRAPVITLRRLPELARTPEERVRLEAFLNAVLNEIKLGAAEGLKYSGSSKETRAR